jgi:phage tail-like protein
MRIVLVLAVLAAAIPAGAQDTPITAARFAISVDGVPIAHFSELQGISSSVDVVNLFGDLRPERYNLEGIVALGRPLSTNLDMARWHQDAVLNGPKVRKNMVLEIFDTQDRPVARYHLENAWPAKIEISQLKAGASEVLLETVYLSCVRIVRVAPQ